MSAQNTLLDGVIQTSVDDTDKPFIMVLKVVHNIRLGATWRIVRSGVHITNVKVWDEIGMA